MPASSFPAATHPVIRPRSIHAAVRLMNAGAETPADPVQRKRLLVADLCRLLGRQFNRPGTNRRGIETSGGGDDSADPGDTPAPAVPLSPRTRQTLDCLLAGDSEKQVAARLGLSRHTVHVYVKTLYRRFGVSSRGELFARFVRRARP